MSINKAFTKNEDQNQPFHKIFSKIEGNTDCFNDVILFKCDESKKPKYNVIFFGGDIQDYENEMVKSSTCRQFIQWNLLNTGNLIFNKFAANVDTVANVFIIRADCFHLKCFANYSNFVQSTDFGIPIGDQNEFTSKLDQNEDGSISSMPVFNDNITDKLRCIEHMKNLFHNSINSCIHEEKIDQNLPIILLGFSKGCVVLNQFCTELFLTELDSQVSEQTINFIRQIEHIFWLDGGHSGTSNSWLTSEEIIQCIKNYNYSCYVYVTPYQMQSPKYWALQEYEKFIELLKKLNVKSKNIYYFQEKQNDDYDVNLHFELLKVFEPSLI